MLRFSITETGKVHKGSAIIFNTIDALDALSTILPPTYAIGPLQLLEKQISENYELKSIQLNLWKEEPERLSWLDSKEPNSVIYVSSATVAGMTSRQLIGFAWGLANSKQNFLWAIRPDLIIGESAALPPEFGLEIKERGLLVSWCPQEQILGHPAVGGFLTHCGWNSILESICGGVPMICWPAFAEQLTNCWFICKQWGQGLEISDFRRDEVERLVTDLMVGEKGKEMKRKAMEWKKLAQEACTAPFGSSCRNFDNIVNKVLV